MTNHRNSSHIKEICRIIETASKYHVKKLEFGDVRVEFFEGEIVRTTVSPKKESSNTEAKPQLDMITAHTVDPDLAEDIRRSQMLLDDPALFEHEIIQQHLGQGAIDDEDEDRRTEYSL